MAHAVGVIGLGNMGAAIAKRIAGKFQVTGYDIDSKRRESLVNDGIHCKDSMEELASSVDVIILSLPRPDISLKVIQTIAPFIRRGTTIIETSTVSPDDMKHLSAECSRYQVKLIDAAILGGISHAVNGTITFLVGGLEEDVQGVKGILAELSKDIRIMGELGTGMGAKIINNGVAHSVMVLIVEAASLAVKMGIPSKTVYELLSGETALQRPLTHRFGERILNGDYEGGMSMNNARKDSTLALSLAQQLGVPLFAIQSTHTVYEIAMQEGLGDLDYAAIATLWEKWINTEFVRN